MIENYEEYINKIKDLIIAKQAEYLLEANRQNYLNAVQEEAKLYDAMVTQQENLTKAKQAEKKAQEQYNEAYKNWIVLTQNGNTINGVATAQLKKAKEELQKATQATKNAEETTTNATNKYKENILIQQHYSDLQSGFMTGNLGEIEKAVEEYTNSYLDNGELVVKSQEEVNERLAYNWGIQLQEYKKTSDKRYQILLDELTNETKAVEKITPEQAIKWKALAEADQEAFLTKFGELPDKLQQQVIDKMQEKGYQISKELQNGINQINPTIKIDADTSKVRTSLTNLLNNLGIGASSTLFGSVANALRISGYASGGLPPVGQLFVANEKGAELVGHIGGQSFVANQNQMMDLLDRKLGQAGNTGTQVFNFYLDENHKLGTYTLDQLKDMAKSNGKPITIS